MLCILSHNVSVWNFTKHFKLPKIYSKCNLDSQGQAGKRARKGKPTLPSKIFEKP